MLPPSFWVAQIYAVDLLQDLLQEFVPGIRVFIRSLQFKVCVLKPGGPERAPPGASEEAFFRSFSTQDENKVMFFSEFVLGSLFETCFQLFSENLETLKFRGAPF
jgi:hypothetical protein